MKKNLLLLVCIFISLLTKAQENPPEVSRFLQLNTYNGGGLSHLIRDVDNNAYLTGTANGKNFNFDNYNIVPVGYDDMYVIKTTVSGENLWLKVVTAGAKGIMKPYKSFLNQNNELYVIGSYSGTINFSGKQFSSTTGENFVLKYGKDGAEKWIFTTTQVISDLSFSTNNTYVATRNMLFRLDDSTANVSANRDFTAQNFKINAVNILPSTGQIFIGGIPLASSTLDGLSLSKNQATILMGDYSNLAISQSSQFQVDNPNNYSSEIFDIRSLADGSVAVSGLSSNKTSYKNNVGSVSQANNSTDYSGGGYYLFTAKISSGLSTLDWLRTSTKIDITPFSSTNPYLEVLEIFPFGTQEVPNNFRVLFKRTTAGLMSYKLPNALGPMTDDGGARLFGSDYSTGLDNTKIPLWGDPTGLLTCNGTFVGSQVLRYDKTPLFWIAPNPAKRKKTTDYGDVFSNYIKHVGTDGSMINYTYQCGKTNYFGTEINNFTQTTTPKIECADILSKMDPSGKTIWKSQLIGVVQKFENPSWTSQTADTNPLGENVTVSQFTNQIRFVDNSSATTSFSKQNTNISNYLNAITATKADGSLKWLKIFEPTSDGSEISYVSVAYDNNQNVIVSGTTSDSFILNNVTYNTNQQNVLFLIKLDAATGSTSFAKLFTQMSCYMTNLDVDNDNNIYLSFEPINETSTGTYNFDGIQVVLKDVNHLFLKFDNNGNTILGKNFYADNAANNYNYSWPFSLKFDGQNFIITGEMYSDDKSTFKGINGQNYSNPYPTSYLCAFVSKVDKSGNVLWHKPIFSNQRIGQNKADFDEAGNIYTYYRTLDKLKIENSEIQLNSNEYSAELLKFSASDGALKYIKNLGLHKNGIANSSLSVLSNNIVSFSGNLGTNDQYVYSINNKNGSNFYISTVGKLPTSYLSPENDYLVVTNIDLPNNISNYGDFNLRTNVDWSITSDQTWLSLSSEKLALKNQFSSSITGSGDNKIILSASQNLTGSPRTAVVTISGVGVASRQITVTQTNILATGEYIKPQILVYPNPVKDFVTVDLTGTSDNVISFSIINNAGQLVRKIKATGEKISKISVKGLTKGIYYLNIEMEHSRLTKKLIVNADK